MHPTALTPTSQEKSFINATNAIVGGAAVMATRERGALVVKRNHELTCWIDMNHKATATCPQGHTVEWGSCKGHVKKLFGGIKICGMKGFEQIYSDGHMTTVSFGNDPWDPVRCTTCGSVFTSTNWPQCGVGVPVTAFHKKGLFARLG
jgi:hypothetical protein